MHWTAKLSLRRKLTLVIMINTVVALCVAGIAYAEYGVQRFKQVGMQDLNTLAKIIGTNCTAPLTFKDPNAAREILQALSVKPHIVAAAIYDLDGKLFAAYRAAPSGLPEAPPQLKDETSRFTSQRALIYQPIYFDGERVGTVFLEGDRGEERQLLLRYVYFFGLTIVVVSLGAYVMAGRLQSPISRPILELAWTTKMVTGSRDYSIRAGEHSGDEVGVLIDGFNEMLGQIQARDTELQLARRDLERRVDERTTELEQEVADRQRAQEALRESEGRLRLILDSTAEAIFGTDQDGRCTFCNPATLRLLGYENADAFLGNCIHDLIHHSRRDGSPYPIEECIIRNALRSGEGLHSDQEVFWRQDGKSFPVEIWAYPIRKSGEAVGAVVTFLDITVRKRAQEALLEAKEAAEAASRAKSEFLANMSHEIRTPMNGIIGMTELALETPLTDEQRDYLNLVKSSADSLLHIINDILDFSKIEAGKLELDSTEFKIRDLFRDTLSTLAVRADKKKTELTVRISPDLPRAVLGDPTRLRQLVVNLVGNSIKFTEQGTIHVNAEREPGGDAEVRLHISVADTGIGIPAEKQQLIFEPFSQADGSTTRQFGGTGLGLSISRQLVELMGGRIWLESEVGKGSTFHFTCVFARGHESASVKEEDASSLIPAGAGVLIVDNNPANHALLSEMLTNWCMKPAAVASAEAALKALEDARNAGRGFSIVLVDAKMPQDDGFRILERIHRDSSLAKSTIAMVPIEKPKMDTARCRELGVTEIIGKPINQSDLLNAILSALGIRAAEKHLALATPPATPGRSARSLRILLAEDNIVNQKLAIRLLEKAGHHVTLASTGQEALQAWERGTEPPFDVVLMDIQMPVMDGMETTAAIRDRERNLGKHIPILAMTAHAMRGDKERCIAGGMDGYISKPIQPAALFAEIGRCLGEEGKGQMANSSVHSSEDFDRASLLERLEGDRELLLEMVDLFRQDAPQLLSALRDALGNGDMVLLERSAHSLKGAASNLSAKRIATAALQLEKDAKSKDATAAEASLAEAERALKNLLPALAELCEGVAK
jgi:two-component system, sensor histidine kinase and response regulator